MGCGRVGAALATRLDEQGHSVAIVDKDPAAFRRLVPGFSGQKVKGIGFDRDTLSQAGIEDAYAFAAVSSGDNSNILSARVARETFGVGKVVARIYDPRRADVYQKLGIATVGPVRWTSRAVLRHMMPHNTDVVFTDEETNVDLLRARLAAAWAGKPFSDIEDVTGASVAYVMRMGEPIFRMKNMVIQENDEVYVMANRDQVAEVRFALTRPVKEEK
ncbi:MAG: TrkA family potassium uptake protein [Actinomycetaceae bacterium]|nr:TrkA family potassium uptake protein [Actinomycetaceae bacterium]